MLFEVRIKETLVRVIDVEAESKEEAEQKIEEMYKNCAIVLDYDDFKGYEITVKEGK